MPSESERHDLEEALSRLQANPEAMPWAERRTLAASLYDALDAGHDSGPVMEMVHLLARDPKPEVRKEIADLLVSVPEDDFAKLAALLSGDTSSFVQKAAERALDRRRKGQRELQRRRQGFDSLESQ